MNRVTPLAAALLLVVSVGCEDEPIVVDPLPRPEIQEPELPEPEPPEADEPESLEAPTAAQAQMHDRYEAVSAMRNAFVRGDLEAAKALARTIGPVTAPLRESAAELRGSVPERARDVVAASDVQTGARAFAATLLACGACHRAADATWTYETPAMPHGEDLPEHMSRHQWAIDRMWEALLVDDAERFDMGARALADAPLTGDAEPDEEEPAGLSGLARRVHTLAGEASSAGSMDERATIFGDMLATCADCHRHFRQLDELGVD